MTRMLKVPDEVYKALEGLAKHYKMTPDELIQTFIRLGLLVHTANQPNAPFAILTRDEDGTSRLIIKEVE